MKRRLSLALLASAGVFTGTAAMAANNSTITFQGEVSAQTCQARVAGQEHAVVMMPTVSVDELKTGRLVGATPFRLEVSGCTTSRENQDILVSFAAPYLTQSNGLANISDDKKKAENVTVRLTLANGEGFPLGERPIVTDRGSVKLKAGADSSSAEYIAWYHADGDVIKPGKVKSVIHYTLTYP